MTSGRKRLAINVGVFVALIVMFLYVLTLGLDPSEGANIGAGVLLLWLLVSLAMLLVAGLAGAVGVFWRRLSR